MGWKSWIGVLTITLLLVAAAVFAIQRVRAVNTVQLRIDDQGTLSLGPIPLSNKSVRHWTLLAVHKICPKATVELVAEPSLPMSELRTSLASLPAAGLPVSRLRIRQIADTK
jgi:hypothetical protein